MPRSRKPRSSQPSTSQSFPATQFCESILENGNDDDSEIDLTMDMEMNLPNMIKYILNRSSTKLPFKKADIVKNVLNGKQNLFTDIFTTAKARLADIYGIKVIECSLEKGKYQNTYICISYFPLSSRNILRREQKVAVSLLFLIVPYIFMKLNLVTETTLCEFLANFNINFEDNHRYFGNVKRLITETFVKQLYLQRDKKKLESTNEEFVEYSLGIRSLHEFPKRKMLKAVARILNKPVEHFYDLYDIDDEEDIDNNSFIDDSQVTPDVD